MFKKTFTAAAIAGLLILGGSSAASANTYPPGEVATTTPAPGQVVAVGFALDFPDGTPVTFVVTGDDVSGVTLATLVRTAVTSKSIEKTVQGGSSSVNFSSSTGGSFTVTPFIDGRQVGTPVSLTVPGGSAGGGTTTPVAGLPATGGDVPALALWLGVGAVGIGGIAVAAGVARRRARTTV